MNLDISERYRYRGPSTGMYLLENISHEEIRFLNERKKCLQSLRMNDADGHYDAEKTYEIILTNARQQLPRKQGHHYVLNITHPEKPLLELVPQDQKLPRNYWSSSTPIEDPNKKQKKRRFKFMDYSRKEGE